MPGSTDALCQGRASQPGFNRHIHVSVLKSAGARPPHEHDRIDGERRAVQGRQQKPRTSSLTDFVREKLDLTGNLLVANTAYVGGAVTVMTRAACARSGV